MDKILLLMLIDDDLFFVPFFRSFSPLLMTWVSLILLHLKENLILDAKIL